MRNNYCYYYKFRPTDNIIKNNNKNVNFCNILHYAQIFVKKVKISTKHFKIMCTFMYFKKK